jgi:hypothetical protein
MKMRMQTFGEIEIDGERYDHDLVIERGGIRKRIKKPSKAYRAHYGHTPLSADEAIPWHGKNLFVGTGMYGKLPVMPELYAAAEEKGIKVVARPTLELCGILQKLNPKDVNAVLHSPVESRASPRSASAGLAPDAAQKKDHAGLPHAEQWGRVTLTMGIESPKT